MSLLASAKQCGNPLFLLTVLDELRFEAKHDTLRHRIEHHLRASDVPELLDQVLNRFETDYEDPQPGLVGAVMKLLWASRSGLAEFELLELLGTKENPLPAAYWSPLRVAADRLIVQRGGLLTFGHPHIRRAVQTRYLGDPGLTTHVRWCLVSYFNDDRRGQRSIHEFPWQLASLEDWPQLANLLAVPRFARALDQAEPGQLGRYWTDIERNSDLQMVDAYRKVLDDPVAWGDAGMTIGNLLYRMGRIAEADTFFRALEEAARSAGSSANTAISLTMRGHILSDQGALEEAAACFTEAARLTVLQGLDEAEIVKSYCSALVGLSAVLQRMGDIGGSLARLDEAALAAGRVGLDDVRIVVLFNRAAVLMDRDDYSAALPVFEEVERVARGRDDRAGAAMALTNQGIALFHLGDPARALRCHQRAEQPFRQMGQRAELAVCLLNEGTVLRDLREPDQAIACFREAEELFTGLGDPRGAANARMNAATIHMDRNEKAVALAECQSAARVFRQHGDQLPLATALKNSRQCMRDGQDEEALPISLELIGIYRAIDTKPDLADALVQHAVLLDNTNQTADAVPALAEAADIYRALDDGKELAKVCQARALVFEKLGRLDEAVVALAEAEEVVRRLGDPEWLREILGSEAGLRYRRGDEEAGDRLAMEAERTSSTDPDQLSQHAILLQERGLADQAILSYDAAARGFRQTGRFRDVGRCLLATGVLRYQQGDLLATVSAFLGAVEAYGHTDDTEGLDHAKAGVSLAGTDLVKDLAEKYKTMNSGSVGEVLALTRGALDAFRVLGQDRDPLHQLHVRLLQQYAQQLAASDRLDDAKELLTELEAAQSEFHEDAAAAVTRGDIERLQRTGRLAADADEDAEAAFHRGVMLDERGDLAGAEAAYRIAAGSTSSGVAPVAALNLGLLLVDRGDNPGAEAAFRVAINSGHRKMAPMAARNLGLILEKQGRDSAAIAAYQTALEFGHSESAAKAAFSLGVLLDKHGDAIGAEAAYRTAVECGGSEDAAKAAVNLGLLLSGRGDVSGAEDAFRTGMRSGYPEYAAMAANKLGVLLYEQGDVAGTEAAWRFAIDSGHPEQAPSAATNLGILLAGRGDAAGAEAAYQIAIASGHPDLAPKAARNLGSMLIDLGDTAGAETALRIAIASGHAEQAPVAAFNLGVLLAKRGDAVAAEAAWRLVIQSGDQAMAAQAAKYIEMLH
jgi:tetratricopeptide (TPR) repeat protein